MNKKQLPVLVSKVDQKKLDRIVFMRVFKTQLENDRLWNFNRTPRTMKEAFGI